MLGILGAGDLQALQHVELTFFVGVAANSAGLGAPVHIFHTIGPQELHVATVQNGVNEILEHAFRIFAGRGDGPDRRRTVDVSGAAFQRSQSHQLAVHTVILQVLLQVGCPGAGPVGEHASSVVIELVTAVLGTIGQGGGVNPALGVAFVQASQCSFHGRLGEAVYPLAFVILIEGRIGILIELRQVVDVGRFGTNKAGSGQRIGVLHAVAVRIVVNEGIAHSGILIPSGGSFHADSIQPSLLDVGNSAAATSISKAIQVTINLQTFDDAVAGKAAAVLGGTVLPCFRHVPQHAFRGVCRIISGRKNHHIRPVAGCDLLLKHIIVSIVVGLDDFQFNAGQLFPASLEFVLGIGFREDRAINKDGNLAGLLHISACHGGYETQAQHQCQH